jgi:hypothetical protein
MIETLPLDGVLAFLVALGVGGSFVLALAVGALYGWVQGQRRRVPV